MKYLEDDVLHFNIGKVWIRADISLGGIETIGQRVNIQEVNIAT